MLCSEENFRFVPFSVSLARLFSPVPCYLCACVGACVGACVCVFERGSEKEREGEITCIIVVFLTEVLLYLILRY